MPAYELKRLRDRDDVIHAGRNLQGFDLVPPPAADRSDDRALRPSRNVRLIACFADAFDDVINLLLGCFFRHVDDHGLVSCEFGPIKQKPRSRIAAYVEAWYFLGGL